jgi:hypothetical protein
MHKNKSNELINLNERKHNEIKIFDKEKWNIIDNNNN